MLSWEGAVGDGCSRILKRMARLVVDEVVDEVGEGCGVAWVVDD